MRNKLYRLTMVILCVAGILFTGGKAAAQGLTVVVAPESQVSGQGFTLGDIASITGDDIERIANLSQVKLGNTPSPGKSYVLSGETLGARLSAAQIDVTGIAWQVPSQFKITALSQCITGQQVLNQAEQHLKTRLAGADVVITAGSQPQDILAPPGVVNFDIELPFGVKYNSPTSVSVGIQVAGQPFTVIKLRFDIKKYEQVAVTSRAIAAREPVSEDSIIFERRDVGRMPPGYFTTLNKILGLTVKRQLAPGIALNDSMLEKPVIIKRGTAVKIVAKIGNIEVSVPGIALQNGSEGQVIRVQNANSKKILIGQVVDETTVRTQ